MADMNQLILKFQSNLNENLSISQIVGLGAKNRLQYISWCTLSLNFPLEIIRLIKNCVEQHPHVYVDTVAIF